MQKSQGGSIFDTQNSTPKDSLSSKQRRKSATKKSTGQNNWIVWKVGSKLLFDSLEEHLACGSYLHSTLSLSRLFLKTLGIWESDYRFRIPNSHNFRKVLIAKVTKAILHEGDDQLLIRVAEVTAADVMLTSDTPKRVILEATSDLAYVLYDIVHIGDYLVIWGDCRSKVVSGGTPVMLLNDDGTRVEEGINIIHYRHDGIFTSPFENHGEVRYDILSGKTTDVYFERNVGEHVVCLHQILPKNSLMPKYKIAKDFRQRVLSDEPKYCRATTSTPTTSNCVDSTRFPSSDQNISTHSISQSHKKRNGSGQSTSSIATTAPSEEGAQLDVDPIDDFSEESDDHMIFEEGGPIELVDLAEDSDENPLQTIQQNESSPIQLAPTPHYGDMLPSQPGAGRDIGCPSEISEGVIDVMENLLERLDEMATHVTESSLELVPTPTKQLKVHIRVTPQESPEVTNPQTITGDVDVSPLPPRPPSSNSMVDSIWQELQEMFSEAETVAPLLTTPLKNDRSNERKRHGSNTPKNSSRSSSISVYVDALSSPPNESRYTSFEETSCVCQNDINDVSQSRDDDIDIALERPVTASVSDGDSACSISSESDLDQSFSEFTEAGLKQFFDLDPNEKTLFDINCHVLTVIPARKGGTEFYLRVEDGTVPTFLSKRFIFSDSGIVERDVKLDSRHSEEIKGDTSTDAASVTHIEIVVRKGATLYRAAERNLGKLVTLTNVALDYDRKAKSHYFSMNGSMSVLTSVNSGYNEPNRELLDAKCVKIEMEQVSKDGQKSVRNRGEDIDSDGSNTSDRTILISLSMGSQNPDLEHLPITSTPRTLSNSSKSRVSFEVTKSPLPLTPEPISTDTKVSTKVIGSASGLTKKKGSPRTEQIEEVSTPQLTSSFEESRMARRKLDFLIPSISDKNVSSMRMRKRPRFLSMWQKANVTQADKRRKIFPISRYSRIMRQQLENEKKTFPTSATTDATPLVCKVTLKDEPISVVMNSRKRRLSSSVSSSSSSVSSSSSSVANSLSTRAVTRQMTDKVSTTTSSSSKPTRIYVTRKRPGLQVTNCTLQLSKLLETTDEPLSPIRKSPRSSRNSSPVKHTPCVEPELNLTSERSTPPLGNVSTPIPKRFSPLRRSSRKSSDSSVILKHPTKIFNSSVRLRRTTPKLVDGTALTPKLSPKNFGIQSPRYRMRRRKI